VQKIDGRRRRRHDVLLFLCFLISIFLVKSLSAFHLMS
jgi:hypothetical protein